MGGLGPTPALLRHGGVICLGLDSGVAPCVCAPGPQPRNWCPASSAPTLCSRRTGIDFVTVTRRGQTVAVPLHRLGRDLAMPAWIVERAPLRPSPRTP